MTSLSPVCQAMQKLPASSQSHHVSLSSPRLWHHEQLWLVLPSLMLGRVPQDNLGPELEPCAGLAHRELHLHEEIEIDRQETLFDPTFYSGYFTNVCIMWHTPHACMHTCCSSSNSFGSARITAGVDKHISCVKNNGRDFLKDIHGLCEATLIHFSSIFIDKTMTSILQR